jgi:hypothetical protein
VRPERLPLVLWTSTLLACDQPNSRSRVDGVQLDLPEPVPLLAEHDLEAADAIMLGSEPGEQAASGFAALGDVDGDGRDDFAVATPRLGTWASELGGAYILRAPPTGTWRLPAADIVVEGSQPDHELGTAVSAAWDMDGDGISELILGGPGEDGLDTDTGSLYVFGSALLGPGAYELGPGDAVASVRGSTERMDLGLAADGRGDLDADGLGDLLVSSEFDLWIFHGPLGGDHFEYDADAFIHSADGGDVFSWSARHVGDVDGDGLGDIATGTYNRGLVRLLLGPHSGHILVEDADAQIEQEASGDYTGRAIAGGTDLDGDGLSDFLVGAERNDNAGNAAGVVYVFTTLPSGDASASTADAQILGPEELAQVGASLDFAGDVDGDGEQDLIIGAPYMLEERGAAFLVLGPVIGSVSLADRDVMMRGMTEGGLAGTAVAGAGDVDGDGLDDLLVGAPWDDTNGSYAGAGFLIYGASLFDEPAL